MRASNQTGFTFNELLVTMGFVTIAVMSYSLSTVQLFRQQRITDHSTTAIHLAQNKMEELQGERPLSDTDNCSGAGEKGLSATEGAGGLFSRCWKVRPSEFGADLKRIDVIVSWWDHKSHELTLSTLAFRGD